MKTNPQEQEKPMDGEIFTRRDLEKMTGWRATFRHKVAIASANESVVCLIRTHKGYIWKMPNRMNVEMADMGALQTSINQGRLVLVNGGLPRGIKSRESQFVKQQQKPRKLRAVRELATV